MSSPHDLAMELISSFRSAAPTAAPAPRRRSEPMALGPSVHVESEPRTRADLLTTLRTRRSTRFFAPTAVPASLLADVVGRGIAEDAGSWPDEHKCCPLQTYVTAFRLDGVEPGMFELDSLPRSYTPVAPLPAAEALHDLAIQWEFCDSAAIISIAADVDRTSEIHGAHGYRLLMGRAAATAYTMWLDAVANGLVGTVFAGFIPASVRQLLHSDGTSRHQLFALALGGAPHTSPEATSHR